MDNVTEITAFAEPWRQSVSIYIRQGSGYARNITFEKVDEGILFDPVLRLRYPEAQTLIDGLWHAGLRPSQGKQSEGVTAAQANHLDDMRAIAFAKLNIEKPGK